MLPHSASTKETAFSTRRVCHKSGSAMHGRQPVCQKVRQMRLPRSSQDSQDVNDEVQILNILHILFQRWTTKKHRLQHATIFHCGKILKVCQYGILTCWWTATIKRYSANSRQRNKMFAIASLWFMCTIVTHQLWSSWIRTHPICPNVLPEKQKCIYRYSYATWSTWAMSGPQWSMWATATSREAKHGSLLKRHLGLIAADRSAARLSFCFRPSSKTSTATSPSQHIMMKVMASAARAASQARFSSRIPQRTPSKMAPPSKDACHAQMGQRSATPLQWRWCPVSWPESIGAKISFLPSKCFGHSLHQTILREACGESMHGPHDCVSRGRMVQLSDLSRSFHCPNQLACRGGAVSSNVSTLMCAGGAINTHLQKIVWLNHFHLEAETSPGATTTFHSFVKIRNYRNDFHFLWTLWMFGVFTCSTCSLEDHICRRLWRRGLQPVCGGLRPVRQQRVYLRQMCVLASWHWSGPDADIVICARSDWTRRVRI